MRTISRLCIPLAAVLIASTPIAAQQGTLTGRVTDEGGMALSQATVLASGAAGTSALTDNQGVYRLQLPAGTYDLTVSHITSRGQVYYGVTVTAGGSTTFDIQLPTRAFELDGVVVTPRRGVQERASESAPMTFTVSSAQIAERPAPTIADQLRSAPGVDIITQGVQSTNVTVRGFNNIFSGSLHVLSDNRLAGVPSLRVNLMHFIPKIEEDVDRIEVVLGPGSALYGPNTANGVVHIISKSPLDHQGTSVTVGGGERSVFQGAFRSAFLVNENVGLKFSGQYLRGDDWEYTDPTEAAARSQADADPQSCIDDKVLRGLSAAVAQVACARLGSRNFDIERYGFEARADVRLGDQGTLVGTYGRTDATGIELTGLGAGQTENWVYQFFQLKGTYDRLFAQIYHNTSDAGTSWLLRDGVPLIDQSTLTVGQLQHGFTVADGRQDFTYGFDYFATRPETQGSINGSYEATDDINEWGLYLQSKTTLSEQFDFIGALRVDDHSLLPEQVWSPRGSLVFKPAPQQNFRFSYNRAFSTPSTLNFFLDINGGAAPSPLGPLGYSTRAYGTGSTGYGFQNPDGSLRGVRSPFNPGGADQLLPADAAALWPLAVGAIAASGQLDPAYVAILQGLAPTGSDVGIVALDPVTQDVLPITPGLISDVPVVEESNTENFELGWTGVFNDRVRIDMSGYYQKKNNFVSPLILQTPLILLNGQDIGAYLGAPFVAARVPFYMGLGQDLATATASAQAEAAVAVPAIATAVGSLPVGVVSSEDVNAQGAELILAYRNVGDIDLFGADVAMQVFLNDEWSATGTFSWVSNDYFASVEYPIALNAPKAKGSLGLAYRSVEGFNASALFRLQKQFPAESAGFVGTECVTGDRGGLFDEECVKGYGLLDLNFGYRIPQTGLTTMLSVTNVFNTDYRSFVGVPAVGRFAMVRMRYEIF
ncbi:MAG: TonB-dependent receptor [Gemmatimonadota bacterium]